MDREELNEWRAQREDEPGALLAVAEYIQAKYPSEEWPAQEVQFVEKVEDEAKDVYEDRRAPGLENQRDRINNQVEEQREKLHRLRLVRDGFGVVADQIRRHYDDCSGRVVEDLKVVPPGAFVQDPDGPEGLGELRAPEGPLVLRPGAETYHLEPTARVLESRDMPTDVFWNYSFEILEVSDEDTWEDVRTMVEEQLEFREELVREAQQDLKFLEARQEVYDALLERRAKGRSMPWEVAGDAPETVGAHITDPPEDLFKSRGTKNRSKGERYARELANLYADTNQDIPAQWCNLHSKVEGETTGRNKVERVREAFQDHPKLSEEPETPEELCQACYHFFPDINVSS
jgi:hypothetical protein